MRRILGIVLAVPLIGGVAVAVVAGRDKDKGTATTTVRGVIGSEKAVFADPDVVKAPHGPRAHRQDRDLRLLGHSGAGCTVAAAKRPGART